ncbi:unnamed protein product [Cochlearia groenlandica]
MASSESTTQPTMSSTKNIPKPPPLPSMSSKRFQSSIKKQPLSSSRLVPKETVETWDKIFKIGIGADTWVDTDSKARFPAHSCVLAVASPVMAELLYQSMDNSGNMYLKIRGVPYEVAYMFIRFLYSSCYEEEEMKTYVLHFLLLSHRYSVPSLKRVCVEVLDQGWINKENVIDVLQLARRCDASRISFVCVSMIIKDLASLSSTDGWKVMKMTDPLLEQELYEAVIEADTREQERRDKLEERRMYLCLYEATEALGHIYREGCGNIGPRDKDLKGRQAMCKFSACKVVEDALRHVLRCKSSMRASCIRCKRMGQLHQLHACICDDSDSCKVPLCWNLKEKLKVMSKKDKSKWRLLAENVTAAKKRLGPFSSRSFALI